MVKRLGHIVFALVATTAACSGVQRAENGRDADLRIDGAQYFEGALPPAEGGPNVALAQLGRLIAPGSNDTSFKGTLGDDSRVVAIGLAGDIGYWLLPAGSPPSDAPKGATFGVVLSISKDILGDRRELVVQAGDDAGHFGAPYIVPMNIVRPGVPQGALVVSLQWDVDADLDLHVVDPSGIEIFNRNINSYVPPPPGQPRGPDDWQKGGILDLDSNARCAIDGRRQENVIWKTEAPKGHYVVRVDTSSLCKEASARWRAEAAVGGALVASAMGASLPTDTRGAHDSGAGVLAFEFDVP